MKIRGVSDISTMYGLGSKNVPKRKEQIVSELARLMHHKDRLKRELSIWVSNQQHTERRLQKVNEQISRLQGAVERKAHEHKELKSLLPEAAPETREKTQSEPIQEPEGWQHMKLEY